MHSQSTYEDLPWQLILLALQVELTPEDQVLFDAWLGASPANILIFERLQKLWLEDLAGYVPYSQADETTAWNVLKTKLGEDVPAEDGPGGRDKPFWGFQTWGIAAVLALLVLGVGTWIFVGRGQPIQYATASGQQRTVALPDGSTLTLQPRTRVQVAAGYNKATRTIVLLDGKATFDVTHGQSPFVVDMDVASIRDLGTSFTVERSQDSIVVSVSSGKIAFIRKENGETKELSAGSALCLYTTAKRHGEITMNNAASLRFDNVPLSTVVTVLESRFGTKIMIQDTATAQKKLTVHLQGESLTDAIRIVCASLSLTYSTDSNGTILIK